MPKIGSAIIRILLLSLFIAVMVVCAPKIVLAQAKPDSTTLVTFVVVKHDGIYKKIIDATEKSLAARGIQLDKTIIEVNKTDQAPKAGESRIISIGTKAAAFAYQQYPDQPITHALITRSSFQQLAHDHFGSADQALENNISPLFIDQPIARFFALGLELVPQAKTIGILVGPSNQAQIPSITAQATSLGLTVNIALLKPNSNPIKIIEPVMRDSDFFVVLPDRKHINQLAAKWALPLSYRYRKPLISYSHKYVDAGALASVYTSPENVAKTIAEQLLKDADTAVPNDDNSKQFSISINRSVARSLRINVQQADVYQKRLQAKEATAP